MSLIFLRNKRKFAEDTGGYLLEFSRRLSEKSAMAFQVAANIAARVVKSLKRRTTMFCALCLANQRYLTRNKMTPYLTTVPETS